MLQQNIAKSSKHNINARKALKKILLKEKKQCFAVIIINENGGVSMFGKKPSEEMDKEDFFSRFDLVSYPDGMGDFNDK